MEDLEKQIEEYALKTSGLKPDFDRKEEEYYQSEKVYVYDLVKTIIKSESAKAFHTKRMYSEEEVFNMLLKFDEIIHQLPAREKRVGMWFEQNKKK